MQKKLQFKKVCFLRLRYDLRKLSFQFERFETSFPLQRSVRSTFICMSVIMRKKHVILLYIAPDYFRRLKKKLATSPSRVFETLILMHGVVEHALFSSLDYT